jgi:hypothetical protein
MHQIHSIQLATYSCNAFTDNSSLPVRNRGQLTCHTLMTDTGATMSVVVDSFIFFFFTVFFVSLVPERGIYICKETDFISKVIFNALCFIDFAKTYLYSALFLNLLIDVCVSPEVISFTVIVRIKNKLLNNSNLFNLHCATLSVAQSDFCTKTFQSYCLLTKF